jgi:hypothetical protein
MNSNAPLVCLITPGHVASTPRLVKNADALVNAGYRVHVVAGRIFRPAEALDSQIFSTARWQSTLVDGRAGAGVAARKLLRRLARQLIQWIPFASPRLAARAHHAEVTRLAATAAAVPASFYFGHGLAGLPGAAFAARARGVKYGFDAEDFHDAETEEALSDRAECIARHVLQAGLLPGCALFTAASPLIAKEYGEAYKVEPTTILNVFPLAQAPLSPPIPSPITSQRPASIYWFSQTVGPGRGLESVVAILGRMKTPVQLCLRGFVSTDYIKNLQDQATRAGHRHPIKFLPAGPSAEMVRLAAEADLGLSTEESLPLNRDLCLTNKIFVYLLAGLPQLMSRTTAQTALAAELGDAALLGDLSRSDETARLLDVFLLDPARVTAARQTAWDLAHRRFCWDIEKNILLESVRAIIGAPA